MGAMSDRSTVRSAALRLPVATLAAAVLVLTACSGNPAATATPTGPPVSASVPSLPLANGNAYQPGSDPIVSVVQRVEPAVVNVTTRTQGVDSIFGGGQAGKAVGTGFVVRSDGVIVTNYHVVEGALNIKVTLPDGRSFPARVIGGNSDHDLAVLKVDGTNLPTVPLGDSGSLKLGETVVALGYALALPGGPTVTT